MTQFSAKLFVLKGCSAHRSALKWLPGAYEIKYEPLTLAFKSALIGPHCPCTVSPPSVHRVVISLMKMASLTPHTLNQLPTAAPTFQHGLRRRCHPACPPSTLLRGLGRDSRGSEVARVTVMLGLQNQSDGPASLDLKTPPVGGLLW